MAWAFPSARQMCRNPIKSMHYRIFLECQVQTVCICILRIWFFELKKYCYQSCSRSSACLHAVCNNLNATQSSQTVHEHFHTTPTHLDRRRSSDRSCAWILQSHFKDPWSIRQYQIPIYKLLVDCTIYYMQYAYNCELEKFCPFNQQGFIIKFNILGVQLNRVPISWEFWRKPPF